MPYSDDNSICMFNINIYSMKLNLTNLQVHMLIYSVSALYCWDLANTNSTTEDALVKTTQLIYYAHNILLLLTKWNKSYVKLTYVILKFILDLCSIKY